MSSLTTEAAAAGAANPYLPVPAPQVEGSQIEDAVFESEFAFGLCGAPSFIRLIRIGLACLDSVSLQTHLLCQSINPLHLDIIYLTHSPTIRSACAHAHSFALTTSFPFLVNDDSRTCLIPSTAFIHLLSPAVTFTLRQ